MVRDSGLSYGMSMTNPVSHEYLQGIRDGREYLKRFSPTILDMRDIIRNLENTMRNFDPGPVKDHLRGERDFWKNQLKEQL